MTDWSKYTPVAEADETNGKIDWSQFTPVVEAEADPRSLPVRKPGWWESDKVAEKADHNNWWAADKVADAHAKSKRAAAAPAAVEADVEEPNYDPMTGMQVGTTIREAAVKPDVQPLPSVMVDSLRRGVPGLMQGASGTALRANAGIMGTIDAVEKKLAAGRKPDSFRGDEDPYGVAFMSPEQRAQFRKQTLDSAGGNAASIAAAEATKADYPAPPVVQQVLQAKTWGEALGAFATDPVRFIAAIGPESLVQSAPGLLAATVMPGGAAAKAATMGLGSGTTDYGSGIIEGLSKAGVDITDANAVREAAKNPELLRQIAGSAMAHAGPVGAVDAVSGGLASKLMLPAKVLAKSKVSRELANVVAQVPVQGAAGGAGEALGELAAGEELQPGNILAEIAGEAFGAPSEVATVGGQAVAHRMLGTPAAAAARGVTSFTEKGSPSDLAKLTPIVVPNAALMPAPSLAPLGQGQAVPQSAEQSLAARLAEQFDIAADDDARAGQQSVAAVAPDTASTFAAQPADVAVEPAGATPEAQAPAAPAETWMGRRGDGYTTEGDAQMALSGRRQRSPDLDWHVEPIEGGKFRLAAYQRSSVDAAANAAATSPTNDLPEPTAAQKEAGNYQKGHISLQGLSIAIENPKGSQRTGTDKDGKVWSTTMEHHYGYIKGTVGNDQDHVDTFIGPDHDSPSAFIVDQVHPSDGTFDEHKVILGARTIEQAREIYESNYAKGWKGGAAITEMPMPQFKVWVKAGVKTRPLSAQARVRVTPPADDAGGPPLDRNEPSPPSAQPQPQTTVFKARKDATVARQALGNTHRLQRVPGGYKLRVATNKELAAAEHGGKRLRRAGSRVNVDSDSLLTAIAKNGGLAMAERADTITEGNRNVGGRMLFTHQGHAIDKMVTLLHEDGFIPDDEVEADGGVRWLQNAVAEEFAGVRHTFSRSGEQWMRQARDAAMGDAPDFDAANISDQALQDAGYFASADDVQAAVDAIVVAEMEAREHEDSEAVEQFWKSLADIENQEERHAIEAQDTDVDTEAVARRRDTEVAAAGEAQAGARRRSQAAEREEGRPGALNPSKPAQAQPAAEGDRDDLQFSRRGGSLDDSAALKVLSETDALFALPKSTAATLAAIAADNDPKIKVRQTDLGRETMYTLTMPNQATALITVRKPAVYGAHVYSADQNSSGDYDWNTTRPGENPEDVDSSVEDVWVDVSRLKSGDGGRLAYNIAATYAHNTGRIFIGDPSGLSDAAMRRRPEQMLSSALKFGTTRHLAPHPKQTQGDARLGVPALKWVYGDDIGNIKRLIDLNLAALENADAAHLTFDPSTGKFTDANRRSLSRAEVTALAAGGLGGKGLAGGNTLARGFVLRALLRDEGAGLEGADGRRDGLLARLVRESAKHPEAVDGLFYSRGSRYQDDLFGERLPDLFSDLVPRAAGTDRDRPRDAAPARGDLDAAPAVPSGTYASTTALVNTGDQRLGHDGPVLSASDAAAALSYLNRSAVERFDALVTDAFGQALAIVGGFKGALTQAAVYPATLMGEAIRIPRAANLWLVHNHPSGSAALSQADLALQAEVARVFDGSGIAVRDIIAVTRDDFAAGSHGVEDSQAAPLPQRTPGATVPRQEREIAAAGKLAPMIVGPSDARQAAREIAAANGDQPGLMLLDAQRRPIAYVPWAPADMLPLKGNGKLASLFRALSFSNAAAGMIVDPRSEYTLEQINNIAGALKVSDVRPLDAIQNGRSLSELGVLSPTSAFKSRGARVSVGLGSAPELVGALKAAFPSLGKAFDKMMARGELGQKGGLVALDSANRRSMAEALASRTPRTAEQALSLLGDGTLPTFQSTDGDTQGFYDPKSGLTFVVLPNVTAATAPGVVLHEVVHGQQRAAIDAKAMALVDDRAAPGHSRATREFLGRVAKRMEDAGEAGNSQEATAYVVEQAVLEGRQQGFSAADGRFMAWVDATFGKRVGEVIRDLVALVRSWALRHGGEVSPTVDDLVAYAKAGVRAAARGDVATAPDAPRNSRPADQTLTPEFTKWFGDSKVVDEAGKPMEVYHDSNRKFTTFRTRSRGENTGNTGMYGNGAYFSPFAGDESDEQTAKHRYRVYLSLKNPFEFDDGRGPESMSATVSKLLALRGLTADERKRGDAWLRDPSRADTTASLAVENIFQQPPHEETGAAMEGERLRVLLEDNGFDGVIATNVEHVDVGAEYVAFHPEQIKLAAERRGVDAETSDIRRSVRGDGVASIATPPSESFARKVQRYGQDMMNRFTVVKNWAESNGVKFSDDADVWSFEERMHGRMASRLQDFRELTVKPLVQKIQKSGFTMAQVGEYLHMQHAEERNAQIARLEPGFTDGSGIATAAARKYLATADPALAAVANELRAITANTLKVLLDAGIINNDMTRAFAGAYKHYVPLKGSGDASAPGKPSGSKADAKASKGNSVDGDIERATGRSGGVDQFIVENILRGHESAIVQAEKNTLGHSLIAFVTEIANPEVATIGDPERRQAVSLGYQYEVTDDAAGSAAVYRTFDNAADAYAWMGRQEGRGAMRVHKTIANQQIDALIGRLDDNEVKVYVAGHAIKVQLNDEGLSRAYQRLGVDKLPVYLAMSRDINRWLSKAYTGYNPEFSVVNPVRDFTTGLINVTGQYGAAASAKAVAKYPRALSQLMRYAYTGKSSAAIDAYRAAGGSTGAAYLGDIERIGADIQQSYNDYVGAARLAADGAIGAASAVAGRKVLRALTTWIEALNQATENAFRLAVFEALRGEHGVNKAASAAKNSTVNFNRKGELGSAGGAMYLFFNPAVQGTAAMMSALAQGNHKWQARALVAGLVGVTYALAALQYGGGDEDDEEFRKIPGYVKDRSLIIRLSAGRYITIPIPYGYAFAATAGNALYSATHGGDIDTISMSLASSVLDNFSPVGNPLAGANRWRDADSKGLLELLPGVPFGDLSKDAVRLISNRSGLGHQIAPESAFDEGKPDHLKLYRSTKGSVYEGVARRLSDATGGTQIQAGSIDISPETLKFWTRAVTGGTGTFVTDTLKLGELGARKAAGEEGDLTPELKEVPVLRRFVREADIRDSRSQYWDAANDAKRAAENLHRAHKAHDDVGMDKVEAASQAQLEAARSFIRYNRRIKRLRDEIDEVAQDDSLVLGMKRIKIKEIEAEERELYDEAVKEYSMGVRTNGKTAAGR